MGYRLYTCNAYTEYGINVVYDVTLKSWKYYIFQWFILVGPLGLEGSKLMYLLLLTF